MNSFPENIQKNLKEFMKNPSANTGKSDIIMNTSSVKLLLSLPVGETFKLKNKETIYKKIKSLRINSLCEDITSGKLYRIHGSIEVF